MSQEKRAILITLACFLVFCGLKVVTTSLEKSVDQGSSFKLFELDKKPKGERVKGNAENSDSEYNDVNGNSDSSYDGGNDVSAEDDNNTDPNNSDSSDPSNGSSGNSSGSKKKGGSDNSASGNSSGSGNSGNSGSSGSNNSGSSGSNSSGSSGSNNSGSSGSSGSNDSGSSGSDNSGNSGSSTSSQDGITLFNDAVSAGKPTKCTYDIANAAMKTDNEKLNGISDLSAAAGQNSTGNNGNASCFTALSADDVSQCTVNDNGSAYTITIKLKTAKLPVNAKPAQKGYEYFMDADTCMKTVNTVNDQMITKRNGNITLSEGTITATVDKASGKMTACKLTLHEMYFDELDIDELLANAPSVIANILKKNMSANGLWGTFDYDLIVNYSF